MAKLIFLTNREMQEQGQRDAGLKPGDFGMRGEPVDSSWETGEPLQQGKALKTLAGLSGLGEGRKHDH